MTDFTNLLLCLFWHTVELSVDTRLEDLED